VLIYYPRFARNLRGRKTDRKDSEWLAHLLRHGLIRPSFIPPPAIRELRSLTRQRRDLIAAAAQDLRHMEFLELEIGALDDQIAEKLKPYSRQMGLCPGNRESTGVQKSGRIRKGNATLRATLNQCAWAAAHTRGTQLKARYEHLLPKRGKRRAIVAISHQMLVLIHFMLTEKVHYSDPGWKHKVTPRYLTRRAYYHVRCLRRLAARLPSTDNLQSSA
jgi:transposase